MKYIKKEKKQANDTPCIKTNYAIK
jgi:hypothetical protein